MVKHSFCTWPPQSYHIVYLTPQREFLALYVAQKLCYQNSFTHVKIIFVVLAISKLGLNFFKYF